MDVPHAPGDVPRLAWVRALNSAAVGPLRYGVAEFERERADGRLSEGDGDLAATEALAVVGIRTGLRSVVFGSPNLTRSLRQVLEATDGIDLTYDHDLTVETAEMQALMVRMVDEEPWFATRSGPTSRADSGTR